MNKRLENLMIFTVVGVAAFLIFGKKKARPTGLNEKVQNFNPALGFAGGAGGAGNLTSTQHVGDSGVSSDTGGISLVDKIGGALDGGSTSGGSGGVTAGDTGLGGWGQVGDSNTIRCVTYPCPDNSVGGSNSQAYSGNQVNSGGSMFDSSGIANANFFIAEFASNAGSDTAANDVANWNGSAPKPNTEQDAYFNTSQFSYY